MRVVFMGTPDFSVPTLTEIVGQGHEVVACYTQPPRKAGRGMELKPSPVHLIAEKFGIPVFNPLNFKEKQDREIFFEHQADAAVVVAYGLILPLEILQAPTYGCINLHASLLPRWRGAAPINRAIMAGDKETGVMVMQMEEGLDTGPVGLTERISIGENETAGELHDRLMTLGGQLTVSALAGLQRESLEFTPQSENGVTYAHKLSKEETRIDWSQPAEVVHNHIRGLSPFPGAWTEINLGGKAQRVKVLKSSLSPTTSGTPGQILENGLTIACAEGSVNLDRVQRSGKGAVTSEEFLRGNNVTVGDVLD